MHAVSIIINIEISQYVYAIDIILPIYLIPYLFLHENRQAYKHVNSQAHNHADIQTYKRAKIKHLNAKNEVLVQN